MSAALSSMNYVLIKASFKYIKNKKAILRTILHVYLIDDDKILLINISKYFY